MALMTLSRYPFLTLLVLLNIINLVDRQLLSSFSNEIVNDLNLTDSQFGLLVGLMFVFFYAIMGLFMGTLADRYNRSKLIAAGLFLWSLLTAYSGMAKNFVQIGIARLMVGVGESTLTPSAMSLLSDLFPASMRGRVSGIYYLGVPLGAGSSFIASGILGPLIGWRNCFLLLGGIGIVLAMFIAFIKETPRGQQEALANDSTPVVPTKALIPELWKILRQTPVLLYCIIGGIFLHIPLGAGQFTILWLVRERGFDAAEINTIYGVLFIIFGTLGVLCGGFLSDWYQRHFKGGRAKFLAIFMLALIPFILSYRYAAPDSPLFFIGMSAGFVSLMAFYGPVFSTVQDLTPMRLRGSMTAVLLLACNMIGFGLGALMTGLLSDTFQYYNVTSPLTKSLIIGDVLVVGAVISFYKASTYILQPTNNK